MALLVGIPPPVFTEVRLRCWEQAGRAREEAAPRGDGEEQQGEGERPAIQISSSNAGNRGMKRDFCLIDEKQMLAFQPIYC